MAKIQQERTKPTCNIAPHNIPDGITASPPANCNYLQTLHFFNIPRSTKKARPPCGHQIRCQSSRGHQPARYYHLHAGSYLPNGGAGLAPGVGVTGGWGKVVKFSLSDWNLQGSQKSLIGGGSFENPTNPTTSSQPKAPRDPHWLKQSWLLKPIYFEQKQWETHAENGQERYIPEKLRTNLGSNCLDHGSQPEHQYAMGTRNSRSGLPRVARNI